MILSLDNTIRGQPNGLHFLKMGDVLCVRKTQVYNSWDFLRQHESARFPDVGTGGSGSRALSPAGARDQGNGRRLSCRLPSLDFLTKRKTKKRYDSNFSSLFLNKMSSLLMHGPVSWEFWGGIPRSHSATSSGGSEGQRGWWHGERYANRFSNILTSQG